MIFFNLFLSFLKVGAFTFGGGYAMIPLIESEILSHGWMELQDFVNFIAVSESTPGPFAINISTYVGAETGGFWGALCATLGVVLPSFCIILIVAKCFATFRSSRIVQGMMTGLRPAVVGLIASAALSVGAAVFSPGTSGMDPAFWFTACFSAAVFLLMLLLERRKIHPIAIIALSALLGIAAGACGEQFRLL